MKVEKESFKNKLKNRTIVELSNNKSWWSRFLKLLKISKK